MATSVPGEGVRSRAGEITRVMRGAVGRARRAWHAASDAGSTSAVVPNVEPVNATTEPSGAASHQLEELRRRIDTLEESLAVQSQVLGSVEAWLRSCVRVLANFGVQPLPEDRDVGGVDSGGSGPDGDGDGAADVLGALATRLDVWAFMEWMRHTPVVDPGPLVSVSIATRDRPELVRRAVESVLRQSYGHLEVVVADDSDGDETAVVLSRIDDPRLKVVPVEDRHCVGSGAACNTALDASTGEILAFFDDDNTMHPEWIRSVVWAFTTQTHVDVLYGARLTEDGGAQGGVASGMLPMLEFQRYDRRQHQRANYIDHNTMAMRSSLRHFRFDESLPMGNDWDHHLRVFDVHTPLALPAIACNYMTVHEGRLSDHADAAQIVDLIRERHQARVTARNEPTGTG